MSIIDELFGTGERPEAFPTITYGRVVDTNDPYQMGRLRVFCPALGDTREKKLKNIPWATYASPFAGMVQNGSRGRGDDETIGPVAYGMWAIPKIGSTVIMCCIDGDTSIRVWLGCVHSQLLSHTMPHGRFSYRDGQVIQSGFEWDDFEDEGKPIGPFSSQEEKIEPTYSQSVKAFTPTIDTVDAGTLGDDVKPQVNFEWRTRGADRSVSGLSEEMVDSPSSDTSFVRDDADTGTSVDGFTQPDGTRLEAENTEQGYKNSRIAPDKKFKETQKNYDSQIYSITTPGFHALSMDDAPNNCRVRFRTTHGHQIILDDTNERIYISTSGGKSWAELDEAGNIDFYAERNISFHAEKDFNITADNIRMKATSGIHMVSEAEIRLHAKTIMHIKSNTDFNLQATGTLNIDSQVALMTAADSMDVKVSGGTMKVEASSTVDIKAGTIGTFEATSNLNLKAGANGNFDAGGVANILAGGNVLITGQQIHSNGPPASPATSASPAGSAGTAFESFWTDRVPEHEPWPRVMTKASVTDQNTGNTHANAAEYTYDDANVGRIERGDTLPRNKNWHR